MYYSAGRHMPMELASRVSSITVERPWISLAAAIVGCIARGHWDDPVVPRSVGRIKGRPGPLTKLHSTRIDGVSQAV